MRRWPLILLLGALTGCVSDNDYDPYPGDGPYVDDGGYYDAPRPIDYDIEQRALYSRGYYYPSAYPYYYGGYGRRYDHDRHDHDDHRGDRGDGRDGDDRARDRSPAASPRDRGDDAPRSRSVPDRPSKAATENRALPSRSGGDRGGGPHGVGRGR